MTECADGENCQAILAADPGSASGFYLIKPTESGPAFTAYCNMTDHGGGWTLAASINQSNKNHVIVEAVDTDGDGIVRDDQRGDKLDNTVIDALWNERIWVQINGGTGDIHCELSKQSADDTTWNFDPGTEYLCGYTFESTERVRGGCGPSCSGPDVWDNYDYRSYENGYEGCYGAASTYVPSGAGGCGSHPSRSGALYIR